MKYNVDNYNNQFIEDRLPSKFHFWEFVYSSRVRIFFYRPGETLLSDEEAQEVVRLLSPPQEPDDSPSIASSNDEQQVSYADQHQ